MLIIIVLQVNLIELHVIIFFSKKDIFSKFPFLFFSFFLEIASFRDPRCQRGVREDQTARLRVSIGSENLR